MTSDHYGIDTHKLHYHPGRVQEWLRADGEWERARKVYPIYVEISPSGACNHRCVFCAFDYIGYEIRFLETAILKDRLSEMARLGVRSVMFAGEGEPLLHKDIAEIILHAKAAGIDCSLTTNATAMTERFTERALGSLSWIKASINAGTANTYAKVNRTKPEDFERTLKNLEWAAAFRGKNRLSVTLGAQMVLLPENVLEAETLA